MINGYQKQIDSAEKVIDEANTKIHVAKDNKLAAERHIGQLRRDITDINRQYSVAACSK